MAMLKRQDLRQDEWLQQLRQLAPQGDAWLLDETHLDCRLIRYAPAQASEYSYRGRVFCESGEWKWRLLPSGLYRCVFLGESDWSRLSEDGSARLSDLHVARRSLMLWGEYEPGRQVWLEQKIARHFDYPVSASPKPRSRVLLTVEEWQHGASGQVQFVRYCSLSNQ